jgi:hypothetical protein
MFDKVCSAKLAAIMIVYVIEPVFEDKTENFRFYRKEIHCYSKSVAIT